MESFKIPNQKSSSNYQLLDVQKGNKTRKNSPLWASSNYQLRVRQEGNRKERKFANVAFFQYPIACKARAIKEGKKFANVTILQVPPRIPRKSNIVMGGISDHGQGMIRGKGKGIVR